jgi:2',3'-cyclic-nucleotide 2'-phosphodiesterase (5'-nucleotidase family)
MKKIVLLAFLLVSILAGPQGIIAGESFLNLTVLHLNDIHGFITPVVDPKVDGKTPIGGAAYVARMIADERARNPEGTILLCAGDMFQGTPISNIYDGVPVLKVLNYLRLDAAVIGNHEFDWGLKKLGRLARAAEFPLLSANIAPLKGKLPFRLKPYIIIERKGLKIAVIGVTTPSVPFTTKPDNVKGLAFGKPEIVLPGLIGELKTKADLIIVLSHIGYDEDKALAEKVSGIDVIVGGHSHTAVTPPAEKNKTIIVQAKCCFQYLGVLKLEIDAESKKILSYNRENNLVPTRSGPEDPCDPLMARILKPYEDEIEKKFAVVVGKTRTKLVRNAQGESNLGNLVSDAIRKAAGSQIAFQNSGGIRTDIDQGGITLGQVFTALPFDNDIISMDLTGEQIRIVLERNVSSRHKILQVSGIKVAYDLSKPDSKVVEAIVDGRPLDPRKTYRVAVNDFLAAGGDEFSVFRMGKNIAHGGGVREAVLDYIKSHGNHTVDAEVEGRIRF